MFPPVTAFLFNPLSTTLPLRGPSINEYSHPAKRPRVPSPFSTSCAFLPPPRTFNPIVSPRYRTPIAFTGSILSSFHGAIRLRSPNVTTATSPKTIRHRHPAPITPTALASNAAVLGGLTEAIEILAATTLVIPFFRRLNLSPILGFLLAGVVLGPHGLRLIPDVEDISQLADFGVLFLLFEMGLELSLDRLRKLRKYAFGMGSLQIILTSAVLGLGALAMGGSPSESAVVGCALSLSSSAFILQILAEKGERQSRAGVATFGVLLMQDIAVVPLLLLVPLLASYSDSAVATTALSPPLRFSLSPAVSASTMHAMREGAQHVLAALGVLNFVVLAGGAFLKRVFTFVADSRSSEAFTSAVLLTALGTALVTEQLGLSMTMGAFMGGVLLAESSFRSRIKVDLEPFRGLFLGLFFITTGMSLDLSLFVLKPLQISFLISSLIFCKSAVATVIGLPFGLSLAESLRVGLLLGQGGEFAFVLFALANKLGFLPDSVNSFLITTVVASMAVTPLLYEVGTLIAPRVDAIVSSSGGLPTQKAAILDVTDRNVGFVLICGYGPVGRVVGRMLSRKFIPWVAVDIDRETVARAVQKNLPVVYGDSMRPSELLEANELPVPEAFVITQSQDELVEDTLGAIRSSFADSPVFLRAKSLKQQKRFLRRGARAMYPETLETSLQLGQSVLEGFRTSEVDISAIKAEVRTDSGVAEAFKEYENWYKTHVGIADDEEDGAESSEEEDVEEGDQDSGNGANGNREEKRAKVGDMAKGGGEEDFVGSVGTGAGSGSSRSGGGVDAAS